jgi:hypothetical protein
VGRLFARICNSPDRPQAGGYNILAKRKDALATLRPLLDMSASIWDADALVDFTGWSFVFFASGVRLFRQ